MVTVIIPVLNEATTVVAIISAVRAADFPKRMIIVDDGSTDGTVEAIESVAGEDLQLLKNGRNYGKGYAVRRALEFVDTEYVALQDADLEYPPCGIKTLLDACRGQDMVVGLRTMVQSGIYTDIPLTSFVANKLFCWLMNVPDPFSGQRLLKTSWVKAQGLRANGFELETELTVKALRGNANISFVPVGYLPRSREEGKKIGFSDFLRILWVYSRETFPFFCLSPTVIKPIPTSESEAES